MPDRAISGSKVCFFSQFEGTGHQGGKGMAVGFGASGHIASAVGKHRNKNPCAQLESSFLYSLDLQLRHWFHLHFIFLEGNVSFHLT